ncbi:DUF6053 domain-containing protein [Lysobacter enzymogenes]|uniref:DUF6053 domain-containing protein n=1 Tax=Lysobacter enzymogenes TaxID=69 RepID=UPI003D2F58D8
MGGASAPMPSDRHSATGYKSIGPEGPPTKHRARRTLPQRPLTPARAIRSPSPARPRARRGPGSSAGGGRSR